MSDSKTTEPWRRDLVGTLRHDLTHLSMKMRTAAADEMERLQAENAALIQDNEMLVDGWTAECNR